jgi:AcrR family transcriptional regulator
VTEHDDTAGLRADARRNRDKLLRAAALLFAEQGVTAPMEEIARRAGLGIGTLYRHFPTRDALIERVYRREAEALHAAALELQRSLPADEALGQWMQRSLDLLATKRGLGDSLRNLLRDRPDLMAVGRAGFPDRLQELVEAAIASGRIRPDVEVADVMQALSGIYSAPPSPDWRARSGRVIELLMDGLRYRG